MDQVYNSSSTKGPERAQLIDLIKDPSIDINATGDVDGWTILHYACAKGDSEIVELLAYHPRIEINKKSTSGTTPFWIACNLGVRPVVEILLKDLRVLIKEPLNDGTTPIRAALERGELGIIEAILASEREGATRCVESFLENYETKWDYRIKALLKAYKDDPEGFKYRIRLDKGEKNVIAAEIFAAVVFNSDGLTAIWNKEENVNAMRFFTITFGLPPELQMMLCFRAIGLSKNYIPNKDSEQAFRFHARRFLYCVPKQ
jgi:hypothetical protein